MTVPNYPRKLQGSKVKNVDPILCRVTGVPFYNTSRYTFEKLKGEGPTWTTYPV